jgi:hypothetical protein
MRWLASPFCCPAFSFDKFIILSEALGSLNQGHVASDFALLQNDQARCQNVGTQSHDILLTLVAQAIYECGIDRMSILPEMDAEKEDKVF